jgi:pimeloyl-[acyl-carrier protein] methyl ester esterase
MLHKTVLGAGPALVLVHGWGMNGAVWTKVAEELARTHRVILLDLPGHGRSPFDPRQRRLDHWRDALLASAPETAIWVGWSLGGSLALAAALAAPERVRALALVTATPRFLQAADWEHGMPADTLGRFRDALNCDPAATLEQFLALQTLGSTQAREVLRTLRQHLAARPAALPEALDAGLELLQRTDLRHALACLEPPSLWLYGNRDTLVPWRGAARIGTLLPTARRVVIPGAAHAPFLSHAPQLLAALRSFLEWPT